jgi:hypothetical protein
MGFPAWGSDPEKAIAHIPGFHQGKRGGKNGGL